MVLVLVLGVWMLSYIIFTAARRHTYKHTRTLAVAAKKRIEMSKVKKKEEEEK